MMPAHYALSDAAIVLVAIWGAMALYRKRQFLPAFAIACFGLAAAIGVVRFGAHLQAELAVLHASASQLLGLAGGFALAGVCIQRAGSGRDKRFAAASLIVAAAVFFFANALIAPLFILALIVALCAVLWRNVRAGSNWLTVAGLALLLANALVIRGAPWLAPAAAWHAYHLLIALALGALAVSMRRAER